MVMTAAVATAAMVAIGWDGDGDGNSDGSNDGSSDGGGNDGSCGDCNCDRQ